MRRSIWHLHETCVRYFSNFRYTEITIHILVNISCLEVIVLISNRCVSTEAFRRKGEWKKKFFVCSFLLNNRRLSVRALGNLWYSNNFAYCTLVLLWDEHCHSKVRLHDTHIHSSSRCFLYTENPLLLFIFWFQSLTFFIILNLIWFILYIKGFFTFNFLVKLIYWQTPKRQCIYRQT